MTSTTMYRNTRTTGTRSTTATGPSARVCACGQALDCCHRAHCPRCGTTLD